MMQEAKRVFDIEIEALIRTRGLLDDNFNKAIDLISSCKGKVIVTGIGKSGIIAKKVASSMASTGTLAVFMDPAGGLHGDLGIITSSDIVIVFSKSGESEELLGILPSIKRIGIKIIAIVGNLNSTLAKKANVVINAGIEREADHLDLVPTASTTVALVIGDALAVSLLKKKNLKREEFALFHPGGTLGKRLLLKVEDLMHSGDELPVVFPATPLKDVILEITSKKMGATNVINKNGLLVGIITDGDLRRAFQRRDNVLDLKARDIMSNAPISITRDKLAVEALELMENRESQIMVLPVVDNNNKAVGIIRVHDLVRIGL